MAKGFGEVAVVVGGRIEVVEGLGHQQVSVGVETSGKLFALIAQVAFDLKLDTVKVVIELVAFQVTAEFFAHGIIRQVGDMADHARQNQPPLRNYPVLLKVPTVEVGVRQDCLACHFVKGDILRR